MVTIMQVEEAVAEKEFLLPEPEVLEEAVQA
jgi:hypothetical protein